MNGAEQRLRNIAARASVIAEAPGVSFIPAGEHSHESRDPSTGTGAVLFDQIVTRAASSSNMHSVADWAERELDRRQHTPPQPVRSQKARVLEDYEGKTCEEVAALEGGGMHVEGGGLHRTTVWRWRRDAGLDPDGHKIAANGVMVAAVPLVELCPNGPRQWS